MIKLRSGGQATLWTWKQLEIRLFRRVLTISISRQYPRGNPQA